MFGTFFTSARARPYRALVLEEFKSAATRKAFGECLLVSVVVVVLEVSERERDAALAYFLIL